MNKMKETRLRSSNFITKFTQHAMVCIVSVSKYNVKSTWKMFVLVKRVMQRNLTVSDDILN